MKRLLKILKAILGVATFCLVVLVGVAAWLWFNPSVLVNPEVASFLLRRYVGSELSWKQLDVSAVATGWWAKRISFVAKGVCYTVDPSRRACVESFDLDGLVDLHPKRLRATVNHLFADGGRVDWVEPVSAPGKASPTSPSDPFRIPSLPSEIAGVPLVWGDVRVALDRANVFVEGVSISGSAKLLVPPVGRKALRASAQASRKGEKYSAALDTTFNPERNARGTLSASYRLKTDSRVAIQACPFLLDWADSKVMRLAIECPLATRGVLPSSGDETLRELLESFGLRFKANLRWENFPTGILGGRVSAIAESRPKRLAEKVHLVRLSFDVDFEAKEDWEIRPSLDAEIPSFQRVCRFLKPTRWAVPVPLHVLEGKVSFTTDPGVRWGTSGGKATGKLTTRLSSIQQRFDTTTDVSFEMSKGKSELTVDAYLSQIRLVLPRLEKKPPPPFFPDRRIRATLERAPASDGMKVVARVHTPGESPILLVSDMATNAIPVYLNVATGTAPTTGSIRLGQFTAELFRRKAKLTRFDIKLAERADLNEINAEIQIPYTDYTIRVLIEGLLKQPQVRFLSDPPLPEDQVLAVALFGKKPDSLDRSEAESAGSFRSAMSDGAVSLATMYLLASTPVESIGYDPMSRVFTAKVKLSDGTSLNIGSDTKSLNQVGIRHRLGNNWAVMTYLSNPLDPVSRALTAFLEWSRGY